MQAMNITKLLSESIEQLKALTEHCQDSAFESEKVTDMLDKMSDLIAQYEKEFIDFRLICDHINTTLFVTDTEGKVLYVNPAYETRTGLNAAGLLGKTIYDLQRDNIIQCNIIPSMLKSGKPMNEIGYVVPTEYRGFISGIPVRDKDDHIVYAMTTDWDVSTIMELEHRLYQLKKGEIDLGNNGNTEDEFYLDDEILYISDRMRSLLLLAKTVAQTDVSVLITGETGTGKELLSNIIVKYSNRQKKPFVKINCAAIPANLLESELFGYDEGAFTGAQKGGKKGAFEQADGGTILLDEIGELPFQIQAKLLRVLQENEVIHVGGIEPIPLDIRIIAATNRNLLREIKKGNFREDLYYRLNIVPLELPPLRDRNEDILFLAGKFLEECNDKYQRNVGIDAGAMHVLQSYGWPGNVRELKNLIERLVIVCVDGQIRQDDVNNILKVEVIDKDASCSETMKEAVERLELFMIKDALAVYGNKKKAAEALGVERSTFVKKCQRYGID